MTAVQWIQHDAEDTIFPKFNGAWSSPHSIEAACAELSQVQGQGSVISIVITCCVAEVTQDKDGRSITLRARDALNLSSVKIEATSVANVSSHDGADNSKASRMAPVASSSRAIVSSSLSSLQGLRACLEGDTGAAMVRWMWDDVGLSRNLARLNPFRWTNWTSLEGAATDLEQYVGTQDAQRPVRLVVLPNMMSSFVTKTDNVTDAWMALRELLNRHDQLSERAWEPLTRESSFISCSELISEDDQQVFEGLAPSGEILISDPPEASRVKLTSRNPNKISHFGWLRELLEKITRGEASETVRDLDKNQAGTPLFVVAGTCPNNFCGMQAVLFSNVATHVDFWWIKPRASDSSSLEQMTLDLHSTGPFKNTAGRSKQLYAPFADKFNCQSQRHGKLAFGVDEIGRAFIEENDVAGQRVRMLLYLVWQESWSSLLARKAFIEGKIFYQRCERAVDGHSTSSELSFFSRQYRIESGDITLAPWQDEEEIHNLLPPDDVQDMYAMTTSRHG